MERILKQVQRFEQHCDKTAVFDREKDHVLARKAAGECMVLLKNDAEILPLSKTAKLAFIGEFAAKPRYQGGGSSHINSSRVDSAWGLVQENCGEYPNISYAQGYDTNTDQISVDLQQQAVQAAKEADTAVIFAGLPDTYESEGYDRTHMRLPENQAALIEAVTAANPHTVVVLHNGSPVEMPWLDRVQAVLEAYLGGQAVGGAQLDVLFGAVNPSGHLAETFPKNWRIIHLICTTSARVTKLNIGRAFLLATGIMTPKRWTFCFPLGMGSAILLFPVTVCGWTKTICAIRTL